MSIVIEDVASKFISSMQVPLVCEFVEKKIEIKHCYWFKVFTNKKNMKLYQKNFVSF